jgi:hypothetical protein
VQLGQGLQLRRGDAHPYSFVFVQLGWLDRELLILLHISKCFSFLVQKAMKSQNSSSQGLAPWDTPYNRALNKVLGNDVGKKPAIGHVVGDENSVRWDYYYHESKDLRKERKRAAHASIEEKIDRLMNRKTRLVI